MSPAFTIWFTGLSASGKSTLCSALANELALKTDLEFLELDGDVMREDLNADLGYSQADRNEASARIAQYAKTQNKNGLCCLVSNISQDRAIRRRVREIIGEVVLIFVDTPIEVCERRDYKGNYQKARSGDISDFVGVDQVYERADEADLVVETLKTEPQEAVQAILAFLETRYQIHSLNRG